MPILEFKEKGNIDIKLEELVPLRDMREIKDTIEELLKRKIMREQIQMIILEQL